MERLQNPYAIGRTVFIEGVTPVVKWIKQITCPYAEDNFIADIYLSFFDVSCFPPQVPGLLAGYDNGILYALNPCAFLARCRRQYGNVYTVSLGFWRFIVVSSGDAISSVLDTSPQLLHNDIMHKEMFYVVAGVRANYNHLHKVMVRELFLLVNRTLSPRTLGETTHGFGLVLLSLIEKFARDHSSGPISLTHLTNEPLYHATNLVLLGPFFPTHTYRDFQTVSKSVPYRFTRTLLRFWSSDAARKRLLKSIKDYLQRGEVMGGGNRFSHEFIKAFEDNGIQSLEGAQLVLNFLWGVHSNTLSNSLFATSFLLANHSAYRRVRAEIDAAVEKFGNLETLLGAGPDKLDEPSFQLLTSAIMETMRLTGLHAGVRQADRGFDLNVKEGTIRVKKGDFVFGDVHATHMDPTAFPNPETFMVDRFAQQLYLKKHLQTEGHSFFSLGGGRHLCKGRWLAIYEIKVLLIILLHLFDFGQVEHSTGWSALPFHPRSIGVMHTERDVFVRLSLRHRRA